MKRYAVLSLLTLAQVPVLADDERTWQGNWTNKRYNTTGPLKCVATSDEDGTWTATFTGEFDRVPFSYEVTFKAKSANAQSELSGNATIKRDKYQWTGSLKGDTLRGRYRASNGYNGDFVLKEIKKKATPSGPKDRRAK